MGRGAGLLRGRSLGFVAGRKSSREPQADVDGRLIRSDEDHALFKQRYQKYPRRVIDWNAAATGGQAPARLLTDAIRRPIVRLTNSHDPGWRGFVLTVERDDGMTWSASAAEEVVEACSDIPRRHIVAGHRADGFPQIVELLPKRRLIALAEQVGVVGRLNTWRPRSIFLAVLALFAIGAATALVQSLTKSLDGLAILVPICGALLVVLGLIAQEVSVPLRRAERKADEARLLKALETAPEEDAPKWALLFERLSQELASSTRDRAVIVDNFDRVDSLTRETIRHFLTHRLKPTGAHEIWIVFEDAGVASLTKEINLKRPTGSRPSRRVHLELLHQTLLDPDAMQRLAAEEGKPDRADFRLVKSIAHEYSEAAEEYARLFDGQFRAQVDDVRHWGPLELAYLLAVQHRSGAWAFREQELVSDLSAKRFSAHPDVLQMLLPKASLNRSEVDAAVDGLKAELWRILDPDRLANHEIELVTEAADVLIERRGEYGLPAKDVVHLYWALYWYAKLSGAPNVDGYRLRKLARHLVLAVAPGALEVEVSEEIEMRFREALIWTAGELLGASLPEDVVPLLLRAERETEAVEERARLRAVCWRAFAVLGDEEVLGLILRLHPGSAGAAPSSGDPEYLFVESLRLPAAEVGSRAELAGRLLSLDREISIYGRVRGLWFALTVNPVIRETWSRFDLIGSDPAPKAAAMVRDALELLDDPTRPRAALAGLSVSLGIWTFGLSTHRGTASLREAVDLLDQVRERAKDLHAFLDDRRLRGESEDYVLRALANEIELMVGAAALVIQNGRFAVAPTERDASDLRNHIREASGSGSSPGSNPADAIARRLTLQELTWRTLGSTRRKPLGFDELATLVTLRRVHLVMLTGDPDHTIGKALAALGGSLDTPGQIGLAALALAMRGTASEEIAAQLWARAAALALRSDLGPGLEIEICLIALGAGHAFGTASKGEIAERLMAPSANAAERSAVWARLTEFAERTRESAALWFLNAAREDVSPGVRKALFDEAKALRDHVADPKIRDEIEQLLDLFELAVRDEEGRPLEPGPLLVGWEHRRESDHYAWMLYLLARRSALTREVIDAGLALLEAHQDAPKGSSMIHLAYELASTPGEGDLANLESGRAVAGRYLDRFRPAVEHELPVEVNIAILKLLISRSVGDRKLHIASLAEWEIARQERDIIEKLPALFNAGRFFLVFWHYCETLYFFGLRTEPEMDLEELLTTDGQVRILAQWRAADELVPAPMVAIPQGLGIAADFVRFGLALFGEAADNPNLDDARERFDEAARDALPQLFDRLEHLPDLPERMRTLLTEHHAQLGRLRVEASRTA